MRTLGPLAAAGTDVPQIADAAVAFWAVVDSELSPVIGRRGCSALYRRSLLLAQVDFPWLQAAYEGAATPGDFASLRDALVKQTALQAAAAHDALTQTFRDLLADLIGRSLTNRLLQAAWDSPSGGPPARDSSQ
ncbi:MAG: hypothetical protein ABIR26_09070 [Ramlibacter sp.]